MVGGRCDRAVGRRFAGVPPLCDRRPFCGRDVCRFHRRGFRKRGLLRLLSLSSGCCRRRCGRDDDASCGAALRRFGDVRCGHQPDDRPKHTCGRSPLHVGLRRGAAATHRNGDDPLDPSDGARRCAACRTNAVRMDGRRRVDDTFRRCRTSVDPARLRCRGRSALRRRSRRLLSGRSAGQLPGLAFHDHRYGGRADGARDVAGGGRACGQPYQDLQSDRLCGYRTGARGARCLGDGQLLRRGAGGTLRVRRYDDGQRCGDAARCGLHRGFDLREGGRNRSRSAAASDREAAVADGAESDRGGFARRGGTHPFYDGRSLRGGQCRRCGLRRRRCDSMELASVADVGRSGRVAASVCASL